MIGIKFKCKECGKVQIEYFEGHLMFDLTKKDDNDSFCVECENCFTQNEIQAVLEPVERYEEVK